MSRGFGATFGVATTDSLATSNKANLTNYRSLSVWFYINGAGGANVGEIFCVGNAGGLGCEFFRMNSGTTTMVYARRQNGSGTTTAAHTYNAPSTGVWTHAVVTHDQSSGTLTAPTVYFNGIKQSNVSTIAPSFSVVTGAEVVWIGNRPSGGTVFDGMIADMTVWDGIVLSDGDALALASGAPGFSIHPEYIAACVPLIGTAVDSILPPGVSTLTGTALGKSDPSIQSTLRLTEWYDRAINTIGGGGFTPIFRRTLSPIGSRVGSRQTHGWGA